MPLRSDASPHCLGNLRFVNRMKVSKANKLYHLTAQFVKIALRKNMLVCVEKPQFSHFWATSFWIEVASKLQYTVFHGCQFGSSRQGKTLLAHNHPAFHQLHRLCPGESKKHQHAAWGLAAQNTFATADETAYPVEVARDVASVFVSILLQAGVRQPPQSFKDIESQSEHVLQAIRAQTAAQPRASKLPPLVPEFKQFVTRPIGPTQPALEQSNLLSSNPFAASRIKGVKEVTRLIVAFH